MIGGGVHTFTENRQAVGGEIIEQRRRFLEEQRQVIFDAGRRVTGLEILEQTAAPGIDVKAVAQRIQRALQRFAFQRHFAAGQQLHRRVFFQRTLRLRIECADGVDFVVEQFDAIRLVRTHRIDVEQTAAHREIAGVEHLRHVAITGAFETTFFRVHVQPLADAHIETAADDVRQRCQPLHQRLHRHHHHAATQRRQAVQCGQPLRNDVGMRTELIVGQGFPIGKRHDRQRGIGADQGAEVMLQLMCGLVVADHRQQWAVVRAGEARNRPCQRTRARGRTPPGTRLAGFGE